MRTQPASIAKCKRSRPWSAFSSVQSRSTPPSRLWNSEQRLPSSARWNLLTAKVSPKGPSSHLRPIRCIDVRRTRKGSQLSRFENRRPWPQYLRQRLVGLLHGERTFFACDAYPGRTDAASNTCRVVSSDRRYCTAAHTRAQQHMPGRSSSRGILRTEMPSLRRYWLRRFQF